FLVTLGMMFILRGVTLATTLMLVGTTQIFGMKKVLAHDLLYPLFSTTFYGMPISILWWLGLAMVAAYILANTKYGNWIYTALGALMFGIINQGFFYTDINDAWFYAIVGSMLLIAVVINNFTRRAAMRPARS